MNKFTLQLHAQCDCVLVLRSMVNVLCGRAKLTEIEKNRVGLAVDELYANIVRHGYRGEAKPLMFEADMAVEEEGLALRFLFQDSAPVVDLSGWDCGGDIQPCCSDKIMPGGLGIPLIHAIMDHVGHEALPDGNRWVMVYRCPNRTKERSDDA